MNECCKQKLTPRNADSKKDLVTRLNKINGQINGVKKMIEEDRYCDEVLIQLSAINKAIKSLANVILDEHLHTCVLENIKDGHEEILDEICDLFRRFQ